MRFEGEMLFMEGFQFHYGSVKRGEPGYWEGRKRIFQFHYGSVKRWLTMGTTSTMKNFNSTMVRLKACVFAPAISTISNFNSTMVRLKDVIQILLCLFWNIFQFHYGSVKRVKPLIGLFNCYHISIPLWFG